MPAAMRATSGPSPATTTWSWASHRVMRSPARRSSTASVTATTADAVTTSASQRATVTSTGSSWSVLVSPAKSATER